MEARNKNFMGEKPDYTLSSKTYFSNFKFNEYEVKEFGIKIHEEP